MEIGIYTFAEVSPDPSDGEAIGPERRLRNLMEEIELADQVGLDVFGVGEHHRPDFASPRPPSCWPRAARTEKIRLTSAVTVSAPTIPCACSRTSPRSTCCRAAAPRSWRAAARSSSRSRCSATTWRTTTSCSPRSSSCCSSSATGERVTWSGRHRAPIDGPRRLSPSRAGADPDLGRGRAAPGVGRPRRDARPADGARDHRRACRSGSRRSPSCTARRRAGRARPAPALSINSHGYIAETSQQALDESFPRVATMMNRIGRERGWPPMTRADYEAARDAARRELRRQPAGGDREDPLPARDLPATTAS